MKVSEQIRVMQAYLDGKEIQYRTHSNEIWYDAENPAWDWSNHEYRIKPENKLVPYDCANEFLEAMKEHGPYIKDNNGVFKLPLVVGKATVVVGEDLPTYGELAKNYWWQDGSPCGIMQ